MMHSIQPASTAAQSLFVATAIGWGSVGGSQERGDDHRSEETRGQKCLLLSSCLL